jgi:hypothetical protein
MPAIMALQVLVAAAAAAAAPAAPAPAAAAGSLPRAHLDVSRACIVADGQHDRIGDWLAAEVGSRVGPADGWQRHGCETLQADSFVIQLTVVGGSAEALSSSSSSTSSSPLSSCGLLPFAHSSFLLQVRRGRCYHYMRL